MMPGGAMPASPAGDPHAGLTADQLAAVRSSGGPQVTDTPPAHWKKQPATSMRQASYLVEGEGGASTDISLVILRGAAGGTLDNVNRWRGQLGQPAIDEATLKQTSQTLTTPVGRGSGGGNRRPRSRCGCHQGRSHDGSHRRQGCGRMVLQNARQLRSNSRARRTTSSSGCNP